MEERSWKDRGKKNSRHEEEIKGEQRRETAVEWGIGEKQALKRDGRGRKRGVNVVKRRWRERKEEEQQWNEEYGKSRREREMKRGEKEESKHGEEEMEEEERRGTAVEWGIRKKKA